MKKIEKLEKLKPFATERQCEYIEAIKKAGSMRKAGKLLGLHDHSTLARSLRSLEDRAALQGVSPEHDMTKAAPDTHYVKGTSTLYGQDGDIKLQWVKTNAKAESLIDIAEQVAAALSQDFEGRRKPTPLPDPTQFDEDLLTVYPMGDPHIGMYAWHEEAGEDFDCDIASENLRQAVDYLVDKAPASKQALICNLGDFFHSDTMDNTTRRSGNALDVDGRWSKVLGVGIDIMVYIIDRALQKHENVHVINEIGNHDDQTSYVLSMMLDAWYRNEPRVTIDRSPMTFHYYRWHNCLIGVTHGHNTKPDDLEAIMAADQSQNWGETTHRYWYVGHIHHKYVKELRGCIVEFLRTLAGKDAWHHSKGYRSGRDMLCIVHHKDHGEFSRHRFDISMITKRAA